VSDEEDKKPEIRHCDHGEARQTEPHTCPYAEEIGGDHHSLCTCCESCQYQCAMDI
jgi:hypothetical protein